MLDADVVKLVTPFYLRMMGTNARNYDSDLLLDVAATGRTVDPADVIQLLQADWRPRVMGAWFALLHNDAGVTAAVLSSLESSLGSLTSPPLAVAAVLLAGSAALPSLAHYAEVDLKNAWGACPFAAAAAEHLGGSVCCAPTDAARRSFTELLAVAEAIRSAP